jgi:hypothetical protein
MAKGTRDDGLVTTAIKGRTDRRIKAAMGQAGPPWDELSKRSFVDHLLNEALDDREKRAARRTG